MARAGDRATNDAGIGAQNGTFPGEPFLEEGRGDLIRRLDAARATLEEAAEVLDEMGEEDAYYDARMAFHIAGEAAGVIEEHDEKAGGGGEPKTEEG